MSDNGLPSTEVSVQFDARESVYRFSDGVIMPLQKYYDYVEEVLSGEYPTEPRETSEAIFRARVRWEGEE